MYYFLLIYNYTNQHGQPYNFLNTRLFYINLLKYNCCTAVEGYGRPGAICVACYRLK